ncbi:hypothetical protein [Nonomuraea glycinis]|uniref:hypothetical protein n=1 Tax=Nonomuraea glycinis TaxID=2047744 RepID=UPI0033AAC89C
MDGAPVAGAPVEGAPVEGAPVAGGPEVAGGAVAEGDAEGWAGGCSAGVVPSTVTVTLGAGEDDVSPEPIPVRNPRRNPSTAAIPDTSRMIVGLLDARG